MSTANCRPTAATPSRHGLPPIRRMPRASPPGARRPRPSARAMARSLNEPVPDAASSSTGSCRSRALLGARSRPRPRSPRSSSAASPAGWRAAHRPRRRADFDVFTAEALDAHKLYIVEVRHPVEVPGDERTHLMPWLSKRLGTSCARPISSAIGLKLRGRPAAAGPVGPAAFFMYEGAVRRALHDLLLARSTTARDGVALHGQATASPRCIGSRSDIAYVVSGPTDRDRLESGGPGRLRPDRQGRAGAQPSGIRKGGV